MIAADEQSLQGHPAERADTSELIRGCARLGDFELTVLTDGHFFLDGGAMFGVVPKPLWEKRAPADAQNRILLGTNTVVLRDGKHTIVIETGIGNKLEPKARDLFAAKQLLPSAFAVAGIRMDEVDVVINSHLHFDHSGWNTTQTLDGSGNFVLTPTFPNARYYAHRGEADSGRLQRERDGVSYISDNYEPLITSGQMILLDGPQQILPGISVDLYPGHTAQLMAINIDSGDRRACYISDLIPTSAHLDLTWGMGYDLDPLRVIEERRRFYSRAIPEQWLVLFTHDHHTPFGYVETNDRGKPVLRAYEGE